MENNELHTKSYMEFHFHIKLSSIYLNKIIFHPKKKEKEKKKAPLLPWNSTPFSTTHCSLWTSIWYVMDISVIWDQEVSEGVSISNWSPFGPHCASTPYKIHLFSCLVKRERGTLQRKRKELKRKRKDKDNCVKSVWKVLGISSVTHLGPFRQEQHSDSSESFQWTNLSSTPWNAYLKHGKKKW